MGWSLANAFEEAHPTHRILRFCRPFGSKARRILGTTLCHLWEPICSESGCGRAGGRFAADIASQNQVAGTDALIETVLAALPNNGEVV